MTAYAKSSLSLLILVVLIKFYGVVGIVIGAAVIPHGDFAYDPSLVNYTGGSRELHLAASAVGKWIQTLNPDLILLTTPHGLSENNNFLLYANSEGSGYAVLGEDLLNNCTSSPKPTYTVPLSTLLSPGDVEAILSASMAVPLNVSSLLAFGDGFPLPLGWGEVIPLSFLRPPSVASPPMSPVLPYPTIVLSMPTRRYHPVPMIPELHQVGRFFNQHLEAHRKRIFVIISADLAHTHLACGPYGYSNQSEPFDNICGEWAQTLNSTLLLEGAGAIADQALSCGFTGLVFLDGLLNDSKQDWKGSLLANFHPTYYGMMVAKFERLNQLKPQKQPKMSN